MRKIIFCVALLACVAYVSTGEFEDAKASASRCAAMVDEGHWPAGVCE